MIQNQLFKVLFDGECPVCRGEADLLRWLDGGKGRLVLEDISSPCFNPARYGRTLNELMAQIHGVLPDGRLVTGLAVFRRAYSAVGLAWLTAPTGWPILRRLAETVYASFARNRLFLTGRRRACDTTCRQAVR
jgi:predicted DCC family thiol-disulfide oxidoreductase YuxK